MAETVYIETTIPSFYCDGRDGSAYRREATRQWWETQRQQFDCYTSYFTLWETTKGVYPNSADVRALAESLPVLSYPKEIDEIIEVYIRNFVMPDDAKGDAAHLAIASYHSIDYLLTWNCKNLANAFKYAHIQKINLRLGLLTPLIVTPEMLSKEDSDA
jgi:hypothetical protein